MSRKTQRTRFEDKIEKISWWGFPASCAGLAFMVFFWRTLCFGWRTLCFLWCTRCFYSLNKLSLKQSISRYLWKKVRRLEKGKPPPVVETIPKWPVQPQRLLCHIRLKRREAPPFLGTCTALESTQWDKTKPSSEVYFFELISSSCFVNPSLIMVSKFSKRITICSSPWGMKDVLGYTELLFSIRALHIQRVNESKINANFLSQIPQLNCSVFHNCLLH